MKPPTNGSEISNHLRSLTPARILLGRAGSGLPTTPMLEFAMDHARARDAVHAALDVDHIRTGLAAIGLQSTVVSSLAVDRKTYLARPDLGRRLDPASHDQMLGRDAGGRLAVVLADGLSPVAVNTHGVELVSRLMRQLAAEGTSLDRVLIAQGARVALGDEIGELIGARMVVMLIGERPGLSAPHSLGAYLTFAPKPGRTDAERNCVSNIHHRGMDYDEAAFRVAWLIREGLQRQVTGVMLKDDSRAQMPPSRDILAP